MRYQSLKPGPVASSAVRQASADTRRPIDIEDLLIWAYADQRVAACTAYGLSPSITSTAVVERVGTLGCRVDGGGAGSGKAHPDAVTIDCALMATAARGLLIHYACLRGRPDILQCRVIPDRCPRSGRVGRLYDDSRHWIGCHVRLTAAPEAVERSKQIYVDWWTGLRSARLLLADSCLRDFTITGPRASRTPWSRPVSRVLPTLQADQIIDA